MFLHENQSEKDDFRRVSKLFAERHTSVLMCVLLTVYKVVAMLSRDDGALNFGFVSTTTRKSTPQLN